MKHPHVTAAIYCSLACYLAACCGLWPQPDPLARYEWAHKLLGIEGYTVYQLDWSPDGQALAMLGYGRDSATRQDILIYQIETATVRRLIGEEEEFTAGGAVWSPTAQYLAVSGDLWFDDNFGGIWLVPSSGGDPTFLTSGHEPTFSPTGDRIAFLAPTSYRVNVLNISTSEETVLLDHPCVRCTIGMFSELEWSPTSDTVAFTVQELVPDGQYGVKVAYILDFDDPVARLLSPRDRSVTSLSWLPNGEALLALINRTEVRMFASDGSCVLQVLPNDVEVNLLDVAPEGDRLAIEAYGRVYVVDLRIAAASQGLPYPLACR